MKFYDMHTHPNLNYEWCPPKIGRWNLDRLEKYYRRGKKYRCMYLVRFLLFVYNLFKRDVSLDYALKVYFSKDPAKYLKKSMKKAGIDKCVGLHIDHRAQDRNWKGAVRYAESYMYLLEDEMIIPTVGVGADVELSLLQKQKGEIIKVYPALIKNKRDLTIIGLNWEKVIVHCSPGGIGKYKDHNDPNNWRKALLWNPNLTIMFAHFGGSSERYRESIRSMMREFRKDDEWGSPRVYADMSFLDRTGEHYYHDFIVENFDVLECICLGTDWPLFAIFESYEDCIESQRKGFGKFHWESFASINPERFLGISDERQHNKI